MAERLLEVCVDDIAGLEAAIEGGADRIELCSALDLGGLTPSAGLMSAADRSPVPCYAMIRPRAGDFVYSRREIDIMVHDIYFAASAGLSGVVFGASLADGRLDVDSLKVLANAVGSMPRTLHRAFDLVPEMAPAIELAIDCGFERILTSGRARTAPEGIDDLADAIRIADKRISIMPGAGVTLATIDDLLARLPVSEVHASCSVSAAIGDARLLALGFASASARQTDVETVRALKAKLTAAQ
jgi:copper homeostasis protein